MLRIDSITGVDAQMHKNTSQTAGLTGKQVEDGASGTSFQDLLKLYTMKMATADAVEKQGGHGTDAYMSYFAPMFYSPGTEAKSVIRDPKSD